MIMNDQDIRFIAAKIRAARAFLDWSQETLAKKSGVGVSTIRDFERGARETEKESIAAMLETLTHAGIVFSDSAIGFLGAPCDTPLGFVGRICFDDGLQAYVFRIAVRHSRKISSIIRGLSELEVKTSRDISMLLDSFFKEIKNEFRMAINDIKEHDPKKEPGYGK